MLNLLCTQIRAEMVDTTTHPTTQVITQSIQFEQAGQKDVALKFWIMTEAEVAETFQVGSIYPADRTLSLLLGVTLAEALPEKPAGKSGKTK